MDLDTNDEVETTEMTSTAVTTTTTTISITKSTKSKTKKNLKQLWPKPHHSQIQNQTAGGKFTKGMKRNPTLLVLEGPSTSAQPEATPKPKNNKAK